MTIPVRSHPIPFRTRKLSSYGPMVLGPQGPGRVGRCQILYISRYIIKCVSAFLLHKKTDTFYSDRIFWTTLLCFKILCTASLMYTAILKHFSSSQTIRSLTTKTKLESLQEQPTAIRNFIFQLLKILKSLTITANASFRLKN